MANKNRPLKWLLAAGIVIVAGGVVTQLNFGDNLVYFYTPKEAVAKASELSTQSVKVGGMVKPTTVVWEPEDLKLEFVMTDLKGTDIQVRHQGIKPDMFKEGQGVVVEGRLSADGQTLTSHKLMVKHSEEYKPQGDHSTMNSALLEESLFKNEKETP